MPEKAQKQFIPRNCAIIGACHLVAHSLTSVRVRLTLSTIHRKSAMQDTKHAHKAVPYILQDILLPTALA